MTSCVSFPDPYVFGGGFRRMPTQIGASKLNGDDALAMVETVALALLALLGLALLRRAEGDARKGGGAPHRPPRPRSSRPRSSSPTRDAGRR